jgi:hypothetical protein
MSTDLATALGAPQARYDRVHAAYDGMKPADKKVFQTAILEPETYTHAQIAAALRELGYDVDRKQVQHFREKLSLGKVEL